MTAVREVSSEASGWNLAGLDDDLVERAREMDARHRELRQRPISAEALRKALGVGAERSRVLTRVVRAEWREPSQVAAESAS